MKKMLALIAALVLVVFACTSCSSNTPAATEAPTAEPVAETEAPTEAPVEETEAPAEETAAPVEETEAPAEETAAPVEETEAPVEETEAPAEETEAPAEESAAPAVEETAAPAAQKPIVVLFTSDVHCAVDGGFGYAGVAGLRDMMSADYEVILVDDGDAIQGDTIGSLTKGEAIVEMMNATGYDVATVGNHEFDYGMDTFLALAEKATYKYVACNFTYMDQPVFAPYAIIERGDKKVAFVGIATPRTFTSSTPVYFQDENGNYVYGFCEDATGEKLYAAVQTAADAARAEGADYVIAMGHLGTEAECSPWMSTEVIANTTGIDALLDGHAHETCAKEIVLNKNGDNVVRAACGTKLANVGYLLIGTDGTIDSGLFTYVAPAEDAEPTNTITTAEGITFEKNADVDAFVTGRVAEFQEYLDTIVAHTDYTLTIVDENGDRIIRNQETNLGDLVADAYRVTAGADIAMVNGGGIRVTIEAGDVTMGSILKAHPFGNILTMVEASGQQILDALEWSTRLVPGESGAFLHVSGLTYEIHTYIESSCTSDDHGMFTGVTGEYRVKNVMVNGEPLDLNKTYTVASHNYLLQDGGDGTCMFMGNPVIDLPEILPDYMVVINYIVTTMGGNVGEEYAAPQGRIVIVSEAPATATDLATPSDLDVAAEATPTDVEATPSDVAPAA